MFPTVSVHGRSRSRWRCSTRCATSTCRWATASSSKCEVSYSVTEASADPDLDVIASTPRGSDWGNNYDDRSPYLPRPRPLRDIYNINNKIILVCQIKPFTFEKNYFLDWQIGILYFNNFNQFSVIITLINSIIGGFNTHSTVDSCDPYIVVWNLYPFTKQAENTLTKRARPFAKSCITFVNLLIGLRAYKELFRLQKH